MSFQRIVVEEIEEPPPGFWSNCLKTEDHVYIAGLVALANDGSVVGRDDSEAQADFIFGSMQKYMAAAGGSLGDIITMTIFVTAMTHRPGVLAARRKHFSGDFPCSTLVAVSALIDPDLLVEINAVGILQS
jgi:2-iminobutanoate/2-iminopropanoate deaminase